ncbi:shadow of prion protein [Mobula birostris]|uniref:shadow of prion protein n=1 Tax=Mobula birostris TaxID=1983395 RepID=UPI003B286124
MNKTTATCWMLVLLVAILCEGVTCKGGRGGARGSARGSARGRFRATRVRPKYSSWSRSYGSRARVAAAGAAAGVAAGVMAGRLQRSRLTWDEGTQGYVSKNCSLERNCTSEAGVYGYRAWTSSAVTLWFSSSLPPMCVLLTLKYFHL